MSQLLKHMHPLMNMEVVEGPKMSYEQVKWCSTLSLFRCNMIWSDSVLVFDMQQ
jgi:hypothetical protein